MRLRSILILFSVFSIGVSHIHARQSDYLIAEDTTPLIVLDKYEQNSRAVFLPFTPFRILDEHVLLSDNVTPALKAEYNGQVFFIVRNDDGKIAGAEAAGDLQILRGCAVLGDSIRVLRDRSLLLYQKYFNRKDNRREYLKKDDILIRIFRYKQGYFVKRINRSPAYGWCRLPAGKSWRKLERQAAGQPFLSQELKLKIKAFVARINLTYENYFGYFNRTYENQIPVPHWQISEDQNEMAMVLTGLSPDDLRRSNEVLIRNLETLLLGSGFTVKRAGNTLRILPRSRGRR